VILRFLLVAVLFFSTLSPALGDSPELEAAVSLAVDGRYEEALTAFENLLKREPENPVLNYYAGMACLRSKQVDRAIAYLEHAVGKKAPFPQAYQWLGEAYQAKEKSADALRVVDQGLARFPRNAALRQLQAELRGGE
jgi:predicted Zn-dependent protease